MSNGHGTGRGIEHGIGRSVSHGIECGIGPGISRSISRGIERIAAAFDQARAEDRAALIVYFTLGYPTLERSLELVMAAVDSGADLVELGVPFSDPLADGPVIQRAAHVARQQGVTLAHCLEAAATLRRRGVEVPLLFMGYYNPILAFGASLTSTSLDQPNAALSNRSVRAGQKPQGAPLALEDLTKQGLASGDRSAGGNGQDPKGAPLTLPGLDQPNTAPSERFAGNHQGVNGAPSGLESLAKPGVASGDRFASGAHDPKGVPDLGAACAAAGVDGWIVPDLPPEEGAALEQVCQAHGLALVYLVAPTSPPDRVRLIAERSRGFVYLVSVTGITGAREQLPAGLAEFVGRVRQETTTPLAVGFGISTPEQAAQVAALADGVIVGSALVRRAAEADGREQVAALVAGLRRGVERGGKV